MSTITAQEAPADGKAGNGDESEENKLWWVSSVFKASEKEGGVE